MRSWGSTILGLELFRSRTVAGVAEAGHVLARKVSADGTPEFNPDDALMLRAGATFRPWPAGRRAPGCDAAGPRAAGSPEKAGGVADENAIY